MAKTSQEFYNYIAKQLESIGDMRMRAMMGGYMIYHRDLLVGGLYGDTLLLKETPDTSSYHLPQVKPYDTAKRTMYWVKDLDNQEKLKELILATYNGLAEK